METDILTKNQLALLAHLGKNDHFTDHFYLTGGTALAAFYLKHRYSEDLDFFSEQEIDMLAIDALLKIAKESMDINAIDSQQSFNRNLFFLHFGDEVLKTEFTYFPFPRIEKGKEQFGVTIDSLLDIAVNKLFTIYQQSRARDYIDLYLICKGKSFSIEELVKKARIKFDWHIDPIQLGSQFIKSKEAKDYPRMITNVLLEEWQEFFVSEAKKLEPQIFF